MFAHLNTLYAYFRLALICTALLSNSGQTTGDVINAIMPQKPGFFIVKHHLQAFEVLPNFIWHDQESASPIPRGFRMVTEGDRWISFAYTSSYNRERSLSLVTGFYECGKEAWHGDVPSRAKSLYSGPAWMIKGTPVGRNLDGPVVIPPLSAFLSKKRFSQATITKISKAEFERIERYVRTHFLPRKDIPGLGREPRAEQEVVAIVVASLRKLGI